MKIYCDDENKVFLHNTRQAAMILASHSLSSVDNVARCFISCAVIRGVSKCFRHTLFMYCTRQAQWRYETYYNDSALRDKYSNSKLVRYISVLLGQAKIRLNASNSVCTGVIAKLGKATASPVVYPSIRQSAGLHGTTRLSPNGFS
jgi:hypothetical protein